MREELLGYLLSALEPHEMRQVEEALRADPLLQLELDALQEAIRPLDKASLAMFDFETPVDLVSRTLAQLPSSDSLELRLASSPSVALANSRESRESQGFAWSDVMVAVLASVAVLGLLIPSIARGRYEARKIACQEHLRQLGTAISQFVIQDASNSLPAIAESGPEAFAGMYALRLADRGLLQDAGLRWCPESELPKPERSGISQVSLVTHNDVASKVSRTEDLYEIWKGGKVAALQWLQQTAGGHYAYSLGVVDDDHYQAPHFEGRTSFAVLGDQPIAGTDLTDGVDRSRLRWGHGSDGANLLFEDGSVKFLDMTNGLPFTDHPFFNHRGSFEAGVNVDDSSLAPSWRPPFISVRQR